MIGPFFPACSTCQCWNGDMCELISDICDRGEIWGPSEDFIAEHPEVFYLVAHRDSLSELTRRRRIELRRLRISQLRRMAEVAEARADWRPSERKTSQYLQFAYSCRREIERLRALS